MARIIEPNEYYTVKETTAILKLKQIFTIYRYIKTKQLNAFRIDDGDPNSRKRYLIKGSDLIAFIERFPSINESEEQAVKDELESIKEI